MSPALLALVLTAGLGSPIVDGFMWSEPSGTCAYAITMLGEYRPRVPGEIDLAKARSVALRGPVIPCLPVQLAYLQRWAPWRLDDAP